MNFEPMATAAAKGAPWIVRSVPVHTSAGVLRVNRQMQVLKAGEIALQTAWPRLHRRIRKSYNAWGPRLAGKLSSPARATAAYLSLVPFAFMTDVVLRLTCSAITARLERIYIESASVEPTSDRA